MASAAFPALDLAGQASETLDLIDGRLNATREALRQLSSLSGVDARPRIDALVERLDGFSPAVTVVGQVKAGKTALTNALSGTPDLLPTDVNPWTSVVTSLHFNQARVGRNAAIFRFFERNEWDSLVKDGGKLARMAKRAELDEEQAELVRQVDEMFARAKERLGANFELLLGRSHAFDQIDNDLIQRYVCAGEDEAGQKMGPGRFAELTKSADLYLQAPHFRIPITLRDTPGVNDPFLVREQITLNSLEHSQLCLVVLSAHQALSTTDIGLIRLLSALRQRQIVLFVNRIDELNDPVSQISEIEERVRLTLERQHLDRDLPVVFGSAVWAHAAQTGDLDGLPTHSRDTLTQLAVELGLGDRAEAPETLIRLSGIPRLIEELAVRIEEEYAEHLLEGALAEATNLAQQFRAVLAAAIETGDTRLAGKPDAEQVADRLDATITDVRIQLDALSTTEIAALRQALEEVAAGFTESECTALREALQNNTVKKGWTVETSELRQSLNRAYFQFGAAAQARFDEVQNTMLWALDEIYDDVLGVAARKVQLSPARLPQLLTPGTLGASMTIDMRQGWWSRWLGFGRSADAHVNALRELIEADTRPLIDGLIERYATAYIDSSRVVVRDYLAEHSKTLLDLALLDSGAELAETLDRAGAAFDREDLVRFDAAIETLSDLMAEHQVDQGDGRLAVAE